MELYSDKKNLQVNINKFGAVFMRLFFWHTCQWFSLKILWFVQMELDHIQKYVCKDTKNYAFNQKKHSPIWFVKNQSKVMVYRLFCQMLDYVCKFIKKIRFINSDSLSNSRLV